MQITPAYRAAGDINPFRFVEIEATGVDNQVIEAAAVGGVGSEIRVVGITQGNNRAFDDTKHAVSGEPVQLQIQGAGMQIEIGEAIDAGDYLGPGTGDGRGFIVAAGAGTKVAFAIADEDGGAAGEVIRCHWQPLNLNNAT